MEKIIKVAIYSSIIPSTNFIENLISELANNVKIKVLLFGKKSSEFHSYSNKNIKTYITPRNKIFLLFKVFFWFLQLLKNKPSNFFKIIRYYKIVIKNDTVPFFYWWGKVLPVIINLPDIFHIQWAKSLSFWFFLQDEFDVKIILSLRGTHINYSPIIDEKLANEYRSFFPRVSHFHSVSNAIGEKALSFGANENKITKIPSILDYDLLNHFRKKTFNLNQHIKLISVGRFHWLKGYKYALDAIRDLSDLGISLKYSIISNEDISEEIMFQIFDLELENIVEIKNNNNQEAVYRSMENSDALILPSIEEGLANVAYEAMAIGLPVISSNCAGMKELIKDGNNGLLFENQNMKSLSDKIKFFINMSYTDRQKISLNAKLNNSNNSSIHKFRKIYESVIIEA